VTAGSTVEGVGCRSVAAEGWSAAADSARTPACAAARSTSPDAGDLAGAWLLPAPLDAVASRSPVAVCAPPELLTTAFGSRCRLTGDPNRAETLRDDPGSREAPTRGELPVADRAEESPEARELVPAECESDESAQLFAGVAASTAATPTATAPTRHAHCASTMTFPSEQLPQAFAWSRDRYCPANSNHTATEAAATAKYATNEPGASLRIAWGTPAGHTPGGVLADGLPNPVSAQMTNGDQRICPD